MEHRVLISPVIYLFTGIPPVSAWSPLSICTFYPLFIVSELAFMFGTGAFLPGRPGLLTSPFFSMNLRALDTVLRGADQISRYAERATDGPFSISSSRKLPSFCSPDGADMGGIQVARGQVDDPPVRHQHFLGRGEYCRHAATDSPPCGIAPEEQEASR